MWDEGVPALEQVTAVCPVCLRQVERPGAFENGERLKDLDRVWVVPCSCGETVRAQFWRRQEQP
jgi:hypothetical protein